jgi:hypothetical protein
VKEGAGRWRERTILMIDEIEPPVEAKPADRYRPQLFDIQFSSYVEPGEEIPVATR